MKTSIILFALIFLTTHCSLADDLSCTHMDYEARVIAENGLKIRSYPSVDSPAVAGVPFWGKVGVCMNYQGEATIDDITAYWRKVRYGKIDGYMFDAYLITVDSTVEKHKDFRLMTEGDPCTGIGANYDPALHWYGVFRTSTGDSLLKVKVKFVVEPNERGFVTTNRSGKYEMLFLFGSRTELKEKMVSTKNIDPPRFLFPGDSYQVYAMDNMYRGENLLTLNAIGTVKDFKGYPEFENYRLRLTDFRNDYQTQDLTDDFTFFGNSIYAQIHWFGDLDGDLKPDLLFISTGSEHSAEMTLFLSTQAKKGKFIQKVDTWALGDCC